MTEIDITYRRLPVYSLAAQQNAYRLFADASVHYRLGDEKEELPTLRNLTVRLSSPDDLLETQVWEIGQLAPGQTVRLQERAIAFSHRYLFALSDETPLTFTFTVTGPDDDSDPLFVRSDVITVLPANFWGGEKRQPELLAAFVKPNGVYVESLVKQVTDVLDKAGHGRSADGYQSNTRERPYLMAAALWNVVLSQKIAYVSPPPSFAHQGQLVRLAREISNTRMGACLDLSVLFASCLELMGLNAVIALTREHAFVGVWLVNSQFPLVTNDDPMDLRKRVDSRDLVLFETTMVTNSTPATFVQACDYARQLIDEEHESDFVYVIDIAQARSMKIKPLSTVEERQDETTSVEGGSLPLPEPPPLPPVRADEQVLEETPETRIDTWQRKLLDLSKRNPLLSLRENASAIRIFSAELGEMEDMLADGVTFNFISSEKSPVNDRERSAESFRLATGNDLHQQFARDQLRKKTLVANMAQKKLENSAIALFRRAKGDLEEGGANTLFMAIGMLRWKEDPRDERSYKAPLILLPVELVRHSARAPIRVRQLADESPIFNSTLIEFLKIEHDIDLYHLRDELPEDESGIDVARVWADVRSKVKDQPGFEVVEESVIAAFSFAKYLMWKDLKDRIDDLKCNPFVAHLVDHPKEAYRQYAQFVLVDQIDEKIDPAEIYTPLNCDSSQIVAVEASAHPQDFVLEGPPGCGKSETIANIVTHNLAKGRKVLFVAEKIAALQVVFRRLQKIKLDHVCLELHSNKANKKAVLEQLRRAVTRRSEQSTSAWIESAAKLRDRRNHLNAYVKALHQPSAFGISPRTAISRVARYQNSQRLTLGWGGTLDDAPIRDAAGLDSLLAIAKKVAAAYTDVAAVDADLFRTIKEQDWSNAWQSATVGRIERCVQRANSLTDAIVAFSHHFALSPDDISLAQLRSYEALVELTQLARHRDLSYAVGKHGKDRLMRLKSIAEFKAALDAALGEIGHGVTAQILEATPIDEWLTWIKDAEASWLKRLFLKRKITRAAINVGYTKFDDLTILNKIGTAKKCLLDILTSVEPIENVGLWHGWDTSPKTLNTALVDGVRAGKAIRRSLQLVDDPATLLKPINSQLIQGHEYLDESKLGVAADRLQNELKAFTELREEMEKAGVVVDETLTLSRTVHDLTQIREQAPKLKAWAEWNAAKIAAESVQLNSLCESLEAGTVLPDDAENQVLTAFCDWLAPRLIDADEHLVRFKSIEHEQLIEEFRALDQQVAETTNQYIAAQLAQSAPDINSPEQAEHFGTLSRELQKKTRHKPVRQLFEDMRERLLDLCPCMMMSPLSVAQFLPSDFKAFDLVVFDEASQITTWDAVGAIARGKNVIVVGDPKQMPPTNFFNTSVGDDGTDEEDLESILDQALAARLPHLRLTGHYRSRHETLIAFSNSKYYDNTLITYPSSETKNSAVTLHRVDGLYAKGKERNNPIEAKAVVDEVVRRLTDPKLNKQSIGVVTFNTEQQRTIEDLLDEARRNSPEIEPFFQASDDYDPVFVKNLESVQGDERDVIIFSLSYGPTEPGARTMSMNFGPLNKSGGERRFNVAITRATTEVILFASFDSRMIDLSRTSATAVEHLKHYLEFAERGPTALAEQSAANYGVDQFDSDFEQAVAWALRNKGWKVQTQVGVSKFRIDLGIVHPDHSGAYLAGIECDGATYHASPSARDRDRTRHAILENLGWRLVRIWSTDYFQDPEAAIDRVHDRLTTILETDRTTATEPERLEVDEQNEFELATVNPAYDTEDEVRKVASKAPDQLTSEHLVPDELDMQSVTEGTYDSSVYYDEEHKPVLEQMARQILTEKPGITLNTLALDIAQLHGLSRTSKKQLDHLSNVLNAWAGVWNDRIHPPVYWASPDQVMDIIPWRGIDVFGYLRDWQEIAYPEALGLAKQALLKQPSDPVDFICNEFALKRRHAKTLEEFSAWVNAVRTEEVCT